MALEINDLITDQKGKAWRLVGVEEHTGRWIAAPVEFSGDSPVSLSREVLREEFGVQDATEDAPAADYYEVETQGWHALTAAASRANDHARAVRDGQAEVVQPPSPEQLFNPQAEPEDDPQPTRRRKPREPVYDSARLGPSGK